MMTLHKGPFTIWISYLLIFVSTVSTGHGQEKIYTGYRLHLSGIRVINQSPTEAVLSFTAVNTGKHPVNTKEESLQDKLILNFDPEALNIPFLSDENPVLEALLSRDILLSPGAFQQISELKILKPGKELTVPTFQIPPKETPDSTQKFNPRPDSTKVKEGNVVATTHEDILEEIDEEDIVLVAPKVERTPIEELLHEKNSCPDLVFDSLKLIKKNDKTAWVEFTIKNIGKGPAVLYHQEQEERPFGIRAYISGTTFISKGAVTIGGYTIAEGLGETEGIILPGEKYVQTVQFDIRKMTRYMPVLILSLDAFLKLRECDRTNNTAHIILE